MFRKLLSLCRVVLTANMPPAVPYNSAYENGDLACDENGALWVHLTPGGGGGSGSGSLANSLTFSSLLDGTGLKQSFIVRADTATTTAALQSVQAHAASRCYLQLHTVDAPINGAFCLFEWACPFDGGVSEEIGSPWGLRLLGGATGITFAFSSTPGFLTLGPYGAVQGIYTFAS